MKKGIEFAPLFADPNPLVCMEADAFPTYIRLQYLGINKDLAHLLSDKTGIQRIIISAQASEKPVDLANLTTLGFPASLESSLGNLNRLMPPAANLVLPFPYPTHNLGEDVPPVGAVLLVNSDTLEKFIKSDPDSRFNLRDIRSWTPYLDRYLRQTFLTVGLDNLRRGVKIWGTSTRSAKLLVQMAQLRFDVNSGRLLAATD